ncbi:MAG: GTP-binding protein, partial [Candidatus Korarchaeota archaeon]
ADHGKTTTADALFLAAGLIPERMAGTALVLDYLPVERQRQMTVKTATMSLYIEKADLLINLIDTPGHVDFSGRVTRAMRIADGAIVVVDVVEGIRAQTEMLTKVAVEEGLRPILFLNKIDR